MGEKNFTKGFSLIESIVIVGIFSIIVIALVSSLIFFYKSNSYSVEQAFAVTSGRRGIENLVRDIREATYSDEGSYPVISMNQYNFSFYSDIDRDLKIERVRYFIDNTLLKKGVTEAVGDPPRYSGGTEVISVISEYIRNEEQAVNVFAYFDANGVEIIDYSDISNLAFVRVNLIVNVNPNRTPNEFTIRSSAMMRNLNSNL